jgi:hypothetical protein
LRALKTTATLSKDLPAHTRDIVPAVVALRDTIAACLVVRDEQERLPAALESVAFCDELIVVDSGSQDRTVEIATKAGARGVEHPSEGFGAQRNIAIDHATADWILEIDADSLWEALIDWWRYARLESAQVPRLQGPGARVNAIVVRPITKLAYRVIVDEGWRDGAKGILRILLDCSADAVVGLRRLPRRSQDSLAPPSRDRQHFGRTEPHRGPVRLVALAEGATDTRRAVAWLVQARDAGADVALVTDRPTEACEPWLFTVPLERLGTFSLLRAVDSIEQVRPIDALVLAYGRSLRIACTLLGVRHGTVSLQRLDDEPRLVVSNVTALARATGPEPPPGVPR